MKQLLLSAAVAAGCLAGSAVSAQGFLYDCDMRDVKKGKGWVSPKVALVLPGDGTVQVIDAVVLHFNGGPLPGTIVRESDKRLVVKWSIENAKADGGKSFAYLDYRASIAKGSGAIELTMIPRHYDAGLRSPGSCRKRNQ